MKIYLVALCSLFALQLQAVEVETKTIDDMAKKAIEMGEKYAPEKVLIVYDIDNTLLAMNQDLGSDQWFTWQESLKEKDAKRVADNFAGLLSAQGTLFALSHMTTPEKQTALVVTDLQQKGFKSIVLSSRGTEFRNATQQELKRNHLEFFAQAIGPQGGLPSTFKPFDGVDLGFNDVEKNMYKVDSQRDISYQDGIVLSSGQHKGAILRAIIKRFDYSPKAIVFIDDQKKHTERVEASFKDTGIETWSFRYGARDAEVEKFNKSDKHKVTHDWQSLNKIVKAVFKY